MLPVWSVLWFCFGVLILDKCLAQHLPASCPIMQGHRQLSNVPYLPETRPDPHISFMDGFVENFLGTVQPNRFPSELVQITLNEPSKFRERDTVRQVLLYEAGFFACAIIGLLYIFLMPLVGLCLACCRCCGNCGGHMYQEQSMDIHRWRRCLYWAMLLTTAIILAGNVCMFCSNQFLSVAVKRAPLAINSAIDNVQTYLSVLPQQISTVVNESFVAVNEMGSNLTDLGPSLGTDIQHGIREHLTGALSSVHYLVQVVNDTSQGLAQLNRTLWELQPKMDRLQASLLVVRNNMNHTLHYSNCTGCSTLLSDLDTISLDPRFTTPNLTQLQSTVDSMLGEDMGSQLNAGEDFLRGVPQMVSNLTGATVQSVMQQLRDIKVQILLVSKKFPMQTLQGVSEQLQVVGDSMVTADPELQKAESYRWIVGLVLCCAVLLVVACNTLGLLLGPLGLQPKVDPTQRSSTANSAGIFLMAGAGLSFLFGWILMLVVIVLFLIGGNMYALLCVPIHDQQLFQIIDSPEIMPQLQLSRLLQLKTNISIGEVYSDCRQNSSLWRALHLEEIFDLNDALNVSKYTQQIEKEFSKKNITLSQVTLLSPDLRRLLLNFSAMSVEVDLGRISQQIQNFSSTSLNTTADRLDHLRNTSDSSMSAELLEEASMLRQIQYNISVDIMPDVCDLNATVQGLWATLAQVNKTVGLGLVELENAQGFLDTNTSELVNTTRRRFLDCQMDYFAAFADWAKTTITQEVGRCGPVAGAVDSLEVVACSYLVASLNAFWFSLGWCVIFLIPSIIFSIKLAKFYRRMKYTDVFEDHIQLTPIPRATFK